MKLFLTGATGFVGTQIQSFFADTYQINTYTRGSDIIIDEDIVIHLAGKAHDLKKVSNASDYYESNTELTKKVFDKFLSSNSRTFIFLSSVKAVADEINEVLLEDCHPEPKTHYGKSKLLAEQYILSQKIPYHKRVYILRPVLIHGPGNKGNLNLLYKIVKCGLPWPLGKFENKRSLCSIDNLIFIIRELIEQVNIPSGIYNIADDEPLSTNQIISILAKTQSRNSRIWNVPKVLIHVIFKIGDLFYLPLNTENLKKLTGSYIVCNNKIISAIGKSLPLSSSIGLFKTFNSFK